MEETSDTEHHEQVAFVSEDPVILDAFADLKTAILAKRTDIVRKIISAAQSMRDDSNDEVEIDGDDEEVRKYITDKYDSEEYVDLLSLLLKHQDTDSGTLLHYATRIGSVDIVRTLLAAGINCTIKNNAGKTAYDYCEDEQMRQVFVQHLMQSVSQSRLFLVKQVLSVGVDVNSDDGATTKNSILHWASSFSDLATLKYIIACGANVNLRNSSGCTPLHDAAQRKNIDIIKELLSHGADVNLKATTGSFIGKSPRDLAYDSGINELMALFEEVNENNDSIASSCDEGKSSYSDINSSLPLPNIRKVNFPKIQDVDKLCEYFCPKPNIIKQFEGVHFVPPANLDVVITNSKFGTSIHDIVGDFIPNFQCIGINLKVVSSCSFISSKSYIQISISKSLFTKPDEYRIQFTTNKVVIIGSTLRSFSYAIVTLLQTLKLFKGKGIPLLQIHDWTSCQHRSVLFDFSNTDFPSHVTWQYTIDTLSMFKISQIRLCTSVFKNNHYHSNLSRFFHDLQMYAKNRFIDIVPYVKISDHPNLLSNVNNNGLLNLHLKSFDDLLDSFICQSVVHVDISGISNPNNIITQIQDYCQLKGCFLELHSDDGDDVMLDDLPKYFDSCAAVLHLASVKDIDDMFCTKVNTGMNVIVQYESKALHRLFPDVISYTNDLFQIINNECWDSNRCYGFCASYTPTPHTMFNMSAILPCFIFANAMCWKNTKLDDAYIENVLNYLYYEDDNDVMGRSYMEVCSSLPVSNHISVLDHVIENCSLNELHLTSQALQDISKAVKLNRTMLAKSLLRTAYKDDIIREFNLLSNIAYLLARICYLMLALNQSNRHVASLHSLQRSDNANRLMSVIKDMEEYYNTHYISKDGLTLSPVRTLNLFLEELLPPSTPTTPSSPLFSVFTI